VDALSKQERIIVWLACHHKVSITVAQLAELPRDYYQQLQRASEMDCPFCLDASSVEHHDKRSAHHLWKDAGEP